MTDTMSGLGNNEKINVLEEDKDGIKEDIVSCTVLKDDKHTPVFILFYTMGILTFIPQTFYVTANNYWMYKFRDLNSSNNTDNGEKTGLQANFTSYYTIISNVLFFTVLFLTSTVGMRIPVNSRIIAPMIMLAIFFLTTLIFPLVDTDSWQQGFFILSLILGSLIHATGACLLISVFQLSSKLSAVYLSAQLAGQSLCGILSALIQILTLAIGASSELSALLYFGIGLFFIVFVMFFYLITSTKIKFFREFIHQKEEGLENIPKISFAIVKKILGKLKFILLTIICTSGSSIMVHPSVTSLVESVGKGNGKWNDIYFVPVCTFLLYNIIDFIGRECGVRWRKPEKGSIQMIFAILRIGFVPLLMLCNARPRSHLPVVFNEDYIYVILLIIFAFGNGYLVNLCIVSLPSAVEDSERMLANILLLVIMVGTLGPCAFLSKALIELL